MDINLTGESLVTAADAASTDAERVNVLHARRALAAIVAYADGPLSGPSDHAEPVTDLVADLVSDLMHLANRQGIDFDVLVDRAGCRFMEECEDELIAI